MKVGSRIRRDELIHVLRTLRVAALEGEGWTRKGVRGWVFTDEVQDLFAGINLLDLVKLELIVREDARDPARRLPLYLHRITQGGEDELAAIEGRDPTELPRARRTLTPADRETLFVPTSAWKALAALARRPEADPWCSLAQIADLAKTQVLPDAIRFLLQRGLAEDRRPSIITRTEPILYAVTPLGRGARARDTHAGAERVQVRVPLLMLRLE